LRDTYKNYAHKKNNNVKSMLGPILISNRSYLKIAMFPLWK